MPTLTDTVPADADLDRLRATLDAVPEAMVVVDDHGVIRLFNRSGEHKLGFARKSLIGRTIDALFPRETSGVDWLALERFLQRCDNNAPPEPLVTRGRRASGAVIDLELRVGRIEAGGEALFLVSMRDITDRLKADERLRALSEELAHASRVTAMGELAADIAHELNQPLAALSNYLEAAGLVLKGDGDADPRVLDLLQQGGRQAHRAGAIINRLRKFMSRGEIDIRPEPVEETVRDAVDLVFVGRKHFGIRIVLAFDPRADRMLADRIQVQQVIVNLLRNAVEALQQTPAESRQIMVKTSREDHLITFSVTDTGPGIPQAVLDRLYKPFSSTKGQQGMGLGLAISRRIVEAHGGRMVAENRTEGGARFCFEVPACNDVGERRAA